VTLEAVIKVVSEFVARTRGPPKQPISADTKLFQEGLIDSFGLFELRSDVEAALGESVPEGELMPDDFESPRALWDRLEALRQ
jgi:acyl carrier protein